MEEDDQQRLLAVFGVSEDDGALVLILGMVLLGLTVMACCYCKVYDPLKLWSIAAYNKHCKKRPKEDDGPPPDARPPAEREHWYLNKTLAIDREDRDELGPQRDVKGLQGGWYGARNGGFNA